MRVIRGLSLVMKKTQGATPCVLQAKILRLYNSLSLSAFATVLCKADCTERNGGKECHSR